MKTVLATCGNSAAELKALLSEAGADDVIVRSSEAEVRRLLELEPRSIVVIDAPLSDSYGTELALNLCEYHDCTVLMICKRDLYENISARLNGSGVFLMSKPFTRRSAAEMFKMICLHRSIVEAKEKKTAGLTRKLEDIKVIDRAKYTLMEYLNISEVEAHRYIEKQAMDGRKTRRQVAEGILKTYL